MATFDNSALKFWEGIIPVKAGLIENLFLDKDADGNWIPLENAEAPLTQFACYGTELTDEQMTKLQMSMG